MEQHIEQVVDLLGPAVNRIGNLSVDDARQALLRGPTQAVRQIRGSFALIARDGQTVRMARSLDRPMRYFLAKRRDGPALVVADRIDTIAAWLATQDLADQFHPSYTRMVPAHYVVEIQLVGCPDPDPVYQRFVAAAHDPLRADVDEIGRQYMGAVANETAAWLSSIPPREPIGICFSGGIDSGAVFLLVYHSLKELAMSPARLKAFTLHAGDGPDALQARQFLERLELGLFLETIDADPHELDPDETVRVVEDYKPLDIESATMALALCRGIRARYPEWKYLADGDGGDENLKDYPIDGNPELTIRSVIDNPLLYQEGWGVGKIKHSLTYSGGLSRSYTRSYAPARRFGFEGFSPFTRPDVVEIAQAIPFAQLTAYESGALYELKGRIVSSGIKSLTGIDMPVFPKRRFQHGATSEHTLRGRLPDSEAAYRNRFLALYA